MKELMSKQQLSLDEPGDDASAQISALESILEMLKSREAMKLSPAAEASPEADALKEAAAPGIDPKLEEKGEDASDSDDEDKLKKLYASMSL